MLALSSQPSGFYEVFVNMISNIQFWSKLENWRIEVCKFSCKWKKKSKNYGNFKISIQIRHDLLFKPGTLGCKSIVKPHLKASCKMKQANKQLMTSIRDIWSAEEFGNIM